MSCSTTAAALRRAPLLCLSLLLGGASPLVAEVADDLKQQLERFRQVERVMDVVEREFITPVDRQRLWAGALGGMVQGLDGYSYYLSQQTAVMHVPGSDNPAAGFGFDWYYDSTSAGPILRRVIPNSAADQAGLVPGDLITHVAEQQILGIGAQAIAERLATVGEDLQLRLRHPDGSRSEPTLVRSGLDDSGISHVRIISGSDAGPTIGLIHINRFLGRPDRPHSDLPGELKAETVTGRALRQHLAELREAPIDGLILDLRGNGGGSIPAAVEVADCFLSGSSEQPTVIARQRGRTPARHQDWLARGDNTLGLWPLVVLIDGGTASAAEVLAAALHEHRRAVLIGSTSQGKDTIQQTYHLDHGGALRLTVARFLTPLGHSLNGQGLTPAVVVNEDPIDRFHAARRRWHERQGQPTPEHLSEATDLPLLRATEVLHGLIAVSPW